METHPRGWSVPQVVDFFRKDAAQFLNIPHAVLPDMDRFASHLEEHHVSGWVLMDHVDENFLKDDCGLKSLGIRRALMRCIDNLRNLPTAPDEPVSRTMAPRTPATSATPVAPETPSPEVAALLTSTEPPELPASLAQNVLDSATVPVGSNIRPAEVQVQDVHGRKRRKLDLTAAANVVGGALTTTPEPTVTTWLPKIAIPVDHLFFSGTKFGQEIVHTKTPGILSPEHHMDPDENFQFQSQDKTDGERAYVWSQMRYFFQAPIRDLRRRDRYAAAIEPYRAHVLTGKKAPSAIVFKKKNADGVTDGIDDGVVAVREKTSHIDQDVDYAGHQDSNSASGEWDFLMQHHGVPDADVEIPVLEASDDVLTFTSSLKAEMEAEQAEYDKARSLILSQDRVNEIVEETIQEVVQKWHQKLPKKEENEARTVWKKMKKSRALREALVQGAGARISKYDDRINKMKQGFSTDEWHSEASLRQTCEIMSVTVEDRENEKWKISVWQRRKEPSSINRQRSSFSTSKVPNASDTVVTHAMMGRGQDRLSMSPGAEQNEPVFTPSEAEEQSSDDINVPLLEEHAPLGGAAISDEVSPTIDPSDDFIVESPTKSDTDELDIYANEEPDYDMPSPDLPGSDPPEQIHEESRDVVHLDSDEESLESVMTLMAKTGSQKPPTKLASSSTAKPVDESVIETPDKTIDLTTLSYDLSAPIPPAKSQRKAKQQRPVQSKSKDSEAALLESGDEVASWNFPDLTSGGERSRIIIKLLFEAGEEARKLLRKTKSDLGIQKLKDEIASLLRSLEDSSHDQAAPALLTQPGSAMDHFARLFLCWMCVSKVETAADLSNIPWLEVHEALTPSSTASPKFFTLLDKVLSKKHAQLFRVSPEVEAAPAAPTAIVISSDDDDEGPPLPKDTPHQKRKREVLPSAAAQQSQTQAIVRQRQFKELVSSSASQPAANSVQINPMATRAGEAIFIDKRISRVMKPHQVDGTRFMWRELTTDGTDGQGCILAHVMGLGKTMQTIALLSCLDSAARSPDHKIRNQLPPHLRPSDMHDGRQLRMLILSPPLLCQNWAKEINDWAGARLPRVYLVHSTSKNPLDLLEEWHETGGVLLMGYQLFRNYISRWDKSRGDSLESKESNFEKLLLEGAEIIVADEAQSLKNTDSQLYKAVSRFHAPCRIGLSGTPLSNDTQEIYALISWVAPQYLGSPVEFKSSYAEPIREGGYEDSSNYEVRRRERTLAVLRALIDPKIDRKDYSVLRGALKSKTEFVITLPISSAQEQTYSKFASAVMQHDGDGKSSTASLWGWIASMTLLLNHPVAFKRSILAALASKQKVKIIQDETPANADDTLLEDGDEAVAKIFNLDKARVLDISHEVITNLIADISDDDLSPGLSSKMTVLMQILEACRACGDGVLVFSGSIPTLDFISDLLTSKKISFGRISGSVPMNKRLDIIKDMEVGRFHIMLLSTKAAGVGLNIQCANRVVVLDFGFNPAHEVQAIGRAYRIGQTKPVFVYRLKVGGTFETEIYKTQLFKTSLTSRVVDKKETRRVAQRPNKEWLLPPRPVPQEDNSQWAGKDELVMDKVMEQSRLGADPDGNQMIRQLITMETLMEEVEPLALTDEEKLQVQAQIASGLLLPRMPPPRRSLAAGPPSTAPPPPPPQPAPETHSAPHFYTAPPPPGTSPVSIVRSPVNLPSSNPGLRPLQPYPASQQPSGPGPYLGGLPYSPQHPPSSAPAPPRQ